jgi:hypothetical protein
MLSVRVDLVQRRNRETYVVILPEGIAIIGMAGTNELLHVSNKVSPFPTFIFVKGIVIEEVIPDRG